MGMSTDTNLHEQRMALAGKGVSEETVLAELELWAAISGTGICARSIALELGGKTPEVTRVLKKLAKAGKVRKSGVMSASSQNWELTC